MHDFFRQRDIEEALLESGQFDDALSSLREWLEKTLPVVEGRSRESVYGDVETVNQFVEENQSLKEEIKSRQASLASVRQRAEQVRVCFCLTGYSCAFELFIPLVLF